jgi:hypothetical protein
MAEKSSYKITNAKCRAQITTADAKKVAAKLGVDFDRELFTIQDFKRGMKIELEHGKCLDGKSSPVTNVTNNDLKKTGQITLAHLTEEFRYYSVREGLPAMEKRLKKTRAAAKKQALSKK